MEIIYKAYGLYLLDTKNEGINFYYQPVQTTKTQEENKEQFNVALSIYFGDQPNYSEFSEKNDSSLNCLNFGDFSFYFFPVKNIKLKKNVYILTIKADSKYPLKTMETCITRIKIILIRNMETGIEIFQQGVINQELKSILMAHFNIFKEANERGECYLPIDKDYKFENKSKQEEEDTKEEPKQENSKDSNSDSLIEDRSDDSLDEEEDENEKAKKKPNEKQMRKSKTLKTETNQPVEKKKVEQLYYTGIVKKVKNPKEKNQNNSGNLFFKSDDEIYENEVYQKMKIIWIIVFSIFTIGYLIFLYTKIY